MLASFPVSMVNQKSTDLGIPNRFKLKSSRFRPTAPLICGIFNERLSRKTEWRTRRFCAALQSLQAYQALTKVRTQIEPTGSSTADKKRGIGRARTQAFALVVGTISTGPSSRFAGTKKPPLG
jgi:hypothetical protein